MPLSLRLAALVVAGAAAGRVFPSSLVPALVALGAASALGAWLARRSGHRGPVAALTALAVVSAVGGHAAAAWARAARPPLVAWFDGRGGMDAGGRGPREVFVYVRGILMRDAVRTPFGVQAPMLVTAVRDGETWTARRGGVAVSIAGDLLDASDAWRAGRVVVAPVALRVPTTYRNAGLPDQASVMARLGTPLAGSVKSGALVEVVAHGAWWDEVAAEVRAAVRRAMRRHVAPRDAASAAVGTAILIGERAELGPDLERGLQEAGTYHVIAISGGNVAMVAAAVLGLLWCLRVRFAAAAAAATLVLVAHGWVVGGGASVLRATAMAAVYLLLRVIDQRTAPVHAISVAAAAMLVWRPLEVTGAGFWLTFGASAALLLTAARWPARAMHRWWTPLAGVVAASLAVEALLMPIGAYVFDRVTVAGLLLNLVAVPAMGVVQAAASLCTVAEVTGLERIADLSGAVTHLAARTLLSGSGLVALAPWTTWRVPPPAPAVLVAYYAGAAAWWWASTPPADARWRRRAACVMAGGLVLAWTWMATAPGSWGRPAAGHALRLTVMDVGQGDSLLVTGPDGHALVVDGGGVPGRFDIGDRVVGPALRARGLRRLDYLAVTHPDLDHLGGASSLLRDFGPRELWAGVPVTGHDLLDQLRTTARASHHPWRWLQRGDRLELGALEIRVHHPPLPDWERQRVRNDDSVVLELRHGAVSVWLTGDISRAVEADLLPAIEPGRLAILKAAHHGSLTSSGAEWLRRLRPVAVLVSAGRRNLFGHPAPAVLQRYRDVGAEVFRTDEDGQIELVTNGHAVEVATFTGRRWRLRR